MAKANKKTSSPAGAPMFTCYTGTGAGVIDTNAHSENDYITPSRLIDPSIPLSRQVSNQVYGASGLPARSISFSSHSVDPRAPGGWPPITRQYATVLNKSNR